MSRVTIKDINPGQPLDVADVNDTIDSWTTATTPTGNINNRKGLDSDNIRDEGLDRRMFTKGDITPSSGRDTKGWHGNKIITANSNYNSQYHLFEAAGSDQIIGPLTYSPPPYDDHMLLVRYHLDVFAAPSENIAKPSPGDQSTYWNQKTQVSTQLAYIISASTPTASSAWIPMPCTRRMVRMGAFGFHGPLIESQGFDINGSVTASSTNLFWGSQAPDYGSLATIFAGKARLRQNICASHIFNSTPTQLILLPPCGLDCCFELIIGMVILTTEELPSVTLDSMHVLL